MRTRILLLALGFPARSKSEVKAKRAMRDYHRLVIARAMRSRENILFSSLFLAVALFMIYYAGFLPALLSFLAPIPVIMILNRVMTVSYSDFLVHLGKCEYHERYSDEFHELCRKTKVRPFNVFRTQGNNETLAKIRSFHGHNAIIVSSLFEKWATREDRMGTFAHELGHHLLPLDKWAYKSGQQEIFHKREFAADAIATLILSSPRPLATFFARFVVEAGADRHGVGEEHPSIDTRISHLLD